MAGTTVVPSGKVLGRSSEPLAEFLRQEHNKVITDLETLRGALEAGGVTAVTELVTDHATFKTVVDDIKTLVNTCKTVADDSKALLNQARALVLNLPLGNPGFVIDTNFDIKNANAIDYLNGGTLKTLSANTSFDTGTAATIATTKWGVAVLTVTNAAAAAVTWFTDAGVGYASEAAAIAAITAPTSTSTVLGYATVQAAGATWTAGTDALQGGTGGTPATTTNYYNLINPNSLLLGAAVSSSNGAAVSSSSPATLSAPAPSATAVDTAGDMTAATIVPDLS